jgi:HK97 family phage major capsid protein
MYSNIERLRARRQELLEAGKLATEAAAAENRKLTPSEQQAYETVVEQIEDIDARIAQQLDYRRAEESMMRVRGDAPPASDENVRAFLAGDPSVRTIDVDFRNVEKRATLTKLFSTTGAATVPTSFREQLYQHLIQNAALVQASTVLTTDGGETLQVPKTSAHSSDAVIVSETSTIPTNEPSFAQVSLGSFKYGALIKVSRELIDDTGVDLQGYLAKQSGQALGNGAGAHFISGTGTGQPRGLFQDTSLGRTATSASAISAVDVQELYSSVIPAYRANATWIMNDSTWSKIRQLTETTNAYLLGSLGEGAELRLLGRPVLIDPYVASVTTGAKSVAFGDLSTYYVRFAGGVRFERSDDAFFSEDVVGFRALLRTDGRLVDTSGSVKHLLHP